MRLYLDVCSLMRPFDDQGISRNRLEAEAVLIIVDQIRDGRHSLVSSEMHHRELAACPDREKAEVVGETLRLAKRHVNAKHAVVKRYEALVALGFRKADAMHLACAEAGKCDYFVTTDDKLAKRSIRAGLGLTVVNPLYFVTRVQR